MFRAVNEELEGVNETSSRATETLMVACECADTTCADMLDIRPADYEAVRAEPRHFAVLPGHVYPEVERIVGERDGFVVVEKIRTSAVVAEALDARTRTT